MAIEKRMVFGEEVEWDTDLGGVVAPEVEPEKSPEPEPTPEEELLPHA